MELVPDLMLALITAPAAVPNSEEYVLRLDTEFLQSVGRRLYDLHRAFLQVGGAGVVVDSIKREVILRLQVAVRAEAVGSGVVRGSPGCAECPLRAEPGPSSAGHSRASR